MTKRRFTIKIGSLLNLIIGIALVIASVAVIFSVSRTMRQQALTEAEAKVRLILDRNMALHAYFSQILKPDLFNWSDPFRSNDYFDPSWMSSTYALREIGKFFKELSPTDYYYKDAAVNARSPENEADASERAFIEQLKQEPRLPGRSDVRTIDGMPYLVVMRAGEVLEESCLRCHSDPALAPAALVRIYGPERGFHRAAEVGNVVSAVSVRVPLAVAYAGADRFAVQLSALLLTLLIGIFATLCWLQKRLLCAPLAHVRDKAMQIASGEEHLGEQIALPFGQELSQVTGAFNTMSVNLRRGRDHLEERVQQRTTQLESVNQRLEQEMTERAHVEEALRESEQRYRPLFDGVPIGLYRTSPEGQIIDANPALAHMLGYPDRAALCATNAADTYADAQERERWRSALEREASARDREMEMRRPDGSVIWVRDNARAVRDPAGRALYFEGSLEDISERKQAEELLRSQSLKDDLTGLYNRRGFLALADQQMKLARRRKSGVFLFFADLDGMKRINDTLGHQEGDRALIEVAGILKNTFRESDIVARLGGDEFAVLALDTAAHAADTLAARLQDALDADNAQAERGYTLSLSMGLARYDPQHPCSVHELLARADRLMYEHKRGKNG